MGADQQICAFMPRWGLGAAQLLVVRMAGLRAIDAAAGVSPAQAPPSPPARTLQLKDLKQELSALRVAKVTGGAPNKLSKIKVVRKGIARVLTVVNQKTREALKESYKGKVRTARAGLGWAGLGWASAGLGGRQLGARRNVARSGRRRCFFGPAGRSRRAALGGDPADAQRGRPGLARSVAVERGRAR